MSDAATDGGHVAHRLKQDLKKLQALKQEEEEILNRRIRKLRHEQDDQAKRIQELEH